MSTKKRNFSTLFTLFIVPLLFYIVLSFGINNFKKLPVLTKNIIDVSTVSKTAQFKNHMSVVCFLGNDIENVKGAFFNLNEKIYKPFYGFKIFQIVAIAPKGSETQIQKLKKQLGAFTDMIKWKFVFLSENEIKTIYKSFKTTKNLTKNLYTSNAFLIDNNVNLRGRTDDEDGINGKLFGYNMESVAALNNKMEDDIKVVLAEYRLVLKGKHKQNE